MFFSGFVVVFWGLGRLAGASGLTRALPDASERTQVSAYPSPQDVFLGLCGGFLGAGLLAGASGLTRALPDASERTQVSAAVCSTRGLPGAHRRRASAYPNPVYRKRCRDFFAPFPDAAGTPRICGAVCSTRVFPDTHRLHPALFPDAGALPAPSEPSARTRSHAEPSARPERSQTRIGVPDPAPENTPPRIIFCDLFGAVPGRRGTTRVFGALSSSPASPAEPPARPEHSQTRIGVPKSHPQKHTAIFFLRPNRCCSRTRGHYPRLRSPLLEPPVHLRSRLLALSAPRRASACPNPTPKNTPPKKKNCDLIGAVPGHGGTTRVFGALSSNPRSPAEPPARPEHSQTRIGPSARPPALPAAPRRRGDFQIRVASNIRAKSAAGNSLGRISSSFSDHERAVGVDGPAVSLPPSTTPVFLVLLPSASLGPGFSRTVQNFSRTLSEIFFVFPLILHHLPSPSHISGPHPAASHNNPQRPQAAMSHHQSNKAKFLTYRATRPYAKEGPGWCYNVACAADVDIAQHAAGTLTDGAFLARMKWKVGHTNDWQRRQREYRGCDVRKTHIWICGWEVSRWYYCEHLTQLEELCDGGERATIDCVCGVSHREYFSFATVGSFTEFNALMTRVITYMNEQPTRSFLTLHLHLRSRHLQPDFTYYIIRHFVLKVTTPWAQADKASVPCWPDPHAVPTKAIHWPDEDDVRVGFRADKSDVRVYFSADKGDVQAGSYADKGDVPLGLFTDKDDVLTKLHADKDSTHKARRGPSWGCHAGHGMGARQAAA
ncbi:hypothetical protein B0H14DRAFT_3525379 [Mycena olivaceomarginata]|nr:hypothetical protein B0H14DRAFT_3525379 [Mycena olivaceomarginata]